MNTIKIISIVTALSILISSCSHLQPTQALSYQKICAGIFDESEIEQNSLSQANIFNEYYANNENRKIAIFLDGTGNDNSSSTNIWKMYLQSVEHACKGEPVIPYYAKGVGTNWYDKIRGGAFGSGIDKNIKLSYEFLAQHYNSGDEIYLFGFSRGAYTARSLNGMIEFANLIDIKKVEPKNLKKQIKDIFKVYNTQNNGLPNFKNKLKAELANNFGHLMLESKVVVNAIGVFDTVPALGFGRDDFPDGHRTNLFAKKGFHALSLDEQRNDFRLLRFDSFGLDDDQTLNEVWFAGAHADVGGGYNDENGLESLARNWMLENFKEYNIFSKQKEKIDCTQPAICDLAQLHDEFLDADLFNKMGISRRIPEVNDTIHGSVICRTKSEHLEEPHKKREMTPQKYFSYNLRENPEEFYKIVPFECIKESSILPVI